MNKREKWVLRKQKYNKITPMETKVNVYGAFKSENVLVKRKSELKNNHYGNKYKRYHNFFLVTIDFKGEEKNVGCDYIEILE